MTQQIPVTNSMVQQLWLQNNYFLFLSWSVVQLVAQLIPAENSKSSSFWIITQPQSNWNLWQIPTLTVLAENCRPVIKQRNGDCSTSHNMAWHGATPEKVGRLNEKKTQKAAKPVTEKQAQNHNFVKLQKKTNRNTSTISAGCTQMMENQHHVEFTQINTIIESRITQILG